MRDERKRFDQPLEVLVLPFQREREDDRPRAELVAASQQLLRLGPSWSRHPDALRDEVDLRRVDSEQPNHVSSRRLGRDDDPVRTACRERYEHAHSDGSRETVSGRMDLVDEVVDRDDAMKRSRRRSGVEEAVQHIDTGTLRESRQKLLLAPYPTGAPARADRNGHGGHEPAPRAVPGFRGLAVDECSDAEIGARVEEGGEQFAHIRLGPARLARYEEDEVETYVRETPPPE